MVDIEKYSIAVSGTEELFVGSDDIHDIKGQFLMIPLEMIPNKQLFAWFWSETTCLGVTIATEN